MDRRHFDTLARLVSAQQSRRVALVTLLSALVVRHDPTAKAQGREHGRNRGHHPGKGKDNRKGKRKDQGVGRPLDCPDGTIGCYTVNQQGDCQALVHQFGPFGHCGMGLSCCPCNHHDQDYWTTQCNNLDACYPSGCIADDQIGLLACWGCPGQIL